MQNFLQNLHDIQSFAGKSQKIEKCSINALKYTVLAIILIYSLDVG
jgi:hypothetical protein